MLINLWVKKIFAILNLMNEKLKKKLHNFEINELAYHVAYIFTQIKVQKQHIFSTYNRY